MRRCDMDQIGLGIVLIVFAARFAYMVLFETKHADCTCKPHTPAFCRIHGWNGV